MKNKNKIICVIVLCLTITLSTLGIRTNVFALENSETIYEAKVYSTATIEDDFDGSSVLVLLDKSISEVNRVHSKEFFGDVEIKSIEE